MCFYVHPKYPRVKIAAKDITCFKKGRRKVINRAGKEFEYFRAQVFTQFKYKIGEEAKMFGAPRLTTSPFEYGVHFGRIKYTRCINEGIHSFSSIGKVQNIISNKGFYCVGKFVIPRGSKCYYNPLRKEYVSDRIKFVEFLYKGKNLRK